jgi:hypothetical protein
MGNVVVRSKSKALVPYRDPSLVGVQVEVVAWEKCFPQNTRYIRPLSQKDKAFHFAEGGTYGVFDAEGELVECTDSLRDAIEWVCIEKCIPIWMC